MPVAISYCKLLSTVCSSDLGRRWRFTRFSDLLIYGFATSVLILHAETVAKDGTHDARRDRTPHRLLTRLARRRCPAAFVALRRPLRPANAGAIRARRGARTGGPPGGFRRPQHSRVDARKTGAAPGFRRIRHHRGI